MYNRPSPISYEDFITDRPAVFTGAVQIFDDDDPDLTPDQRLLLATIEDAICILIGRTPSDPHTFRRTWLWLQSRNTGWPFYAKEICLQLGIEQRHIVEAVRPRLKNNCPKWLKGRPL